MKQTQALCLTATDEVTMKSNNLNIKKNGELVYLTFPSLELSGVAHCFTTKHGGASSGIFSTMNMSFTRGDDQNNVIENYRRICEALGTDYKKCVLSHQTHTTNIRIVTEADAGKGIVNERDYGDVDGLITNVKGLTLVTQYADCVGLLFFDPEKRVIATSHAGWRGTVGKIGLKTVEEMVKHFDCNPKSIRCGIAPSIGKCCFEVDSPVYEEFIKMDSIDLTDCISDDGNGKYHIDLWEVNRRTLISAGISPENISVTDLCTKCLHEDFFSHRYTNGKRGNLAAMIALI